MRTNLSFINVYKKRSLRSKIVTQFLYGETFKIIQEKKSWFKVKNDSDNYIGFIKKNNFFSNQKATHKICKLSAELYSSPGVKIKKKLSFGSEIKVIGIKNNFYKFDNFWIKKKDLKKINYTTSDIIKNIKKFINVKYKWGGKHFSGIDCSGLLQIFFSFNNKFCPRDTKDQIKYFKKKVDLKNIKEKDLIFWKGHIAIVISKKKLIHAYGPMKKTIVMPIKETIDRIYKTTNLKVIGIRRLI